MTKKLLPILLFFACAAMAQNNSKVSVTWQEIKTWHSGNDTFLIPVFQQENFGFDSYSKQVFFSDKKSIAALIDESSLTISDLVYSSISISELGAINKKNIPSEFKPTIQNSIARDVIFSNLLFNPIFKSENGYAKVVSFTYSYKSDTGKLSNLASKNANPLVVSSSVLASGKWYKFYIEKSGIYKLSKNFIQSLGVNLNGVNPSKIKIYGNGGRMLPLKNSDFYPNDLRENAIQVIGETDGVFDNSDYLLFYGEGVDTFNAESDTNLNLYSDRSYYYVTVDGTDGKRITILNQPTGNTALSITNFDRYEFHEKDLINIVKTGRRWFGESFAIENEQEFEFKFPNFLASETISAKIYVGGASFNSTNFSATSNGTNIGTVNLTALTIDSDTQAIPGIISNTVPSAETIKVKIKFENNGVPTSKGYLDYIQLKGKCNLTGYGKQFKFQIDNAATTSGIGEFQFTNASGIKQVWDITDIYNVVTYENISSAANFSFKANLGEVRKYITLEPNDYFDPKKEQKTLVANQDLKGTIFKDVQGNFKDIDYIIIAPKSLNTQAEKLANFHRNYSQLNVKVVTLDLIYEEFASGKQDIGAIRNFLKYVYQNASTPSNRIKYLNLFGDASFDFKDRIQNNSNIVPIYHSLNSFTAGEASFSSDDFFAQMDFNEGLVDFNSSDADFAVGRMIVNDAKQAEEMVNKVLEYHDINSYGNWRNNYVAIADDPDSFKTQDRYLQFYQNRLTDNIHVAKPFINFKKIFLDAYQQESSAGGDRYPKAREAVFSAFEKGVLVYNYLGHGGEDGLTNERVWEKSDGTNLNNRYKYPLFITITCDFSRFDNPLKPTAGEFTYWNPKGGAISMITTIRSIGQGSAQIFNDKLAEALFSFGSNSYPSMAESLRMAKIANNNNSASKVIFYLGDPAIKLAIPQQKIVLTKVNDVAIGSGTIDDLKALSFVKLSGEIQDENGNPITNYNGELQVNIFDKEYLTNTLRNDNSDAVIDNNNTLAPTMAFETMGETIFRGNASIANGQFEFGFVVPKDIKIPVGNGKASFYAKRDNILLDKTGLNTDIKIGGINLNAAEDKIAPTVRLYMNDETFVNGGITNQSPFFLAFLDDENGINTASGIGHDMVAILDGDEANPYVVNDYYETELDNYKKGKIRFPFRNLSKGLHTIVFKAWDVYNNFVSSEIQFNVVDDENITLTNVLNYPNPFVNYTQFWFTHNKPFEPLDVQVQILTITGKVVKTINQSVLSDGFLSREITWDGRDDFGDKIGKGVYIYKLTVRSTTTGKKGEKIEKLVIL
jgi:flagellar hook assembly protein FlgD